ncbi:MAG: hypothetical protein J7464_11120 [Chloroflexus sp.]|jgi:hypothetical protein|nr:hypothetical protein [Chloroflexus sp.]
MSDALLREIEKVIQGLQEPDVCCYLDQASKSFSAGAYDAAIVMAWSATIAHLIREVNQIGPGVFQCGFRKEYPDRKKVPSSPEELVGDDDKSFIQVCQQMRFLRVAKDNLHRFRDRRNRSAHPTQTPATKDEARECLALCLKVVSHPAQDVRILDDALLVEYALESGSSAETIVGLVHTEHRLSAATKILQAYLSNSEPQYDALVGVWHRIWGLFSDAYKAKLWRNLAIEVVRVLKHRNPTRNSQELANLIVWPDPTKIHLYRDFIAKQYILSLKRKVQNKTFSDEDKDFALWLYEKVPKNFQKQIVRLCILWLIRRVKCGDFTGADLDFNAWLKSQSGSAQQIRFQIIKDAIVRRY